MAGPGLAPRPPTPKCFRANPGRPQLTGRGGYLSPKDRDLTHVTAGHCSCLRNENKSLSIFKYPVSPGVHFLGILFYQQ